MAAKVNFDFRREPAKMKEVFFANEEGRLRKIIFRRDAPQSFIRQPFLQGANPSRVALERLRGESVNVIIAEAHSRIDRTSAPGSRFFQAKNYFAPWSIQARTRPTCSAVSGLGAGPLPPPGPPG